MKVIVAHNPGAGEEPTERDDLVARIEAEGHEVEHLDLTRGQRSSLRRGADLVAVAGGDGTVHDVFVELAGSDVPVAVVPLGTANNIGRTLSLPLGDPSAAVRQWRASERRPFHLPRLVRPGSTTRFVEAVGGGLFADLLRRAADEPDGDGEGGEGGVDKGLRLLRQCLGTTPARPWELTVDGIALTQDFVAVEIMNIRGLGPDVVLAPDADPTDRFVHLVAVPEDRRQALVDHIDARRAGRSAPVPDLPRWRAQQVAFVAPPGCRLHLDDDLLEPVDGLQPGRVDLDPLAVDVLVPSADLRRRDSRADQRAGRAGQGASSRSSRSASSPVRHASKNAS